MDSCITYNIINLPFIKNKFVKKYLLGAGVGGGGGGFGLLPNVVSAVELTPNRIMKTVKSIVKLPHCVNRLSGCIFIYFVSILSGYFKCFLKNQFNYLPNFSSTLDYLP